VIEPVERGGAGGGECADPAQILVQTDLPEMVGWSPFCSIEEIVQVSDDCLGSKGRMRLKINKRTMGEAVERALREPGDRHDAIGALYATGSGKSTITKSLMALISGNEPSSGGPRVRAGMQMRPTTSGVTFYRTEGGGRSLYLMDSEGQGGLRPVTEAQGEQVPGWNEARKLVTRVDLQRLVYVTAHVVVFVCDRELSDNDAYKSRIQEMVECVTEQVDNTDLPALVIVATKLNINSTFSKGDLERSLDPDHVTRMFLETHDPEGTLLGHFFSVTVVAVPNRDIRGQLSTGEAFDGSQLYASQLLRLWDVLSERLEEKAGHRRATGNMVNESAWLRLQHVVVRDFYVDAADSRTFTIAPVNMASSLLRVLVRDTEDVRAAATHFFEAILERRRRVSLFGPRVVLSTERPLQRYSLAGMVELPHVGDDALRAMQHASEHPGGSLEGFKAAVQWAVLSLALARAKEVLDFFRARPSCSRPMWQRRGSGRCGARRSLPSLIPCRTGSAWPRAERCARTVRIATRPSSASSLSATTRGGGVRPHTGSSCSTTRQRSLSSPAAFASTSSACPRKSASNCASSSWRLAGSAASRGAHPWPGRTPLRWLRCSGTGSSTGCRLKGLTRRAGCSPACRCRSATRHSGWPVRRNSSTPRPTRPRPGASSACPRWTP
jgi:hypothetical protein